MNISVIKIFLKVLCSKHQKKIFSKKLDDQGNSIAVILKHISGNLLSSFTDFLTTDGEKEWRDRESEFHVGKRQKQN